MILNEDLSNTGDVLKPYLKVIRGCYDDIELNGKNIITANVQHPSLLAYYDEQKVEVKHLLNYSDVMLKKHRGKIYNEIKKTYPKALTVTEIDKIIEGNDTYVEMYCKMLDVKEAYEKLVAITNAMSQKSYTLTNLVKIYEHEMQNITIHINE